jgi:hypothetical protein
VRRIPHRAPARYDLLDLPLFTWAATRDLPPLTPGGRWLSRRYRLPRELANLVAELASIGLEQRR